MTVKSPATSKYLNKYFLRRRGRKGERRKKGGEEELR